MAGRGKEASVLAGDVGGTKSSLGLFAAGRSRPALRVAETFPSRAASGLEGMVGEFMHRHPARVAGACFGIAGPVVGGRSRATNLPWEMSEKAVRDRFGWTNVRLVNDLAATAAAVPLLTARELHPLNKVRLRQGGNMALLAPGTGLGQALLIPGENGYEPVASEGGHADFAPTTRAEASLWEYLHSRFGRVSVERVLSGDGLVNIYRWLRDAGCHAEPSWLARRIEEGDPARVITQAALARRSRLCWVAHEHFISIFGSVAGNLALTGMALGGLFLGGGIPPKIASALEGETFMKAFLAKGRMRGLLEKVPVRVVLNDKAALLGAATIALERS